MSVVVIPAYNEETLLPGVLADVRSLGVPVIVVDDASTDQTAARAEAAGAQVARLPCRLGAWGATQTGIRHALLNGAQFVVTMDGDGQHLSRFIPELLRPVREGKCDLVIGSCVQRGSLGRHCAWGFFRALTGLKTRDLTSGFRVYNRKAARAMLKKEAVLADFQDIGILLLARRRGLRIREIQVDMRPRAMGKSHIFSSWLRVIYYLAYTLIVAMTHK